ncbi:MAG: DUF427 domain-containing protein [Deltaproteobacteria bacterium]|nr:DUF427 domain-containing protein [Deltaproteobacteria bacterium]MBW2397032.1 DUF427 domain-containing protein [Deltaproteobacteria bacterium]
MEDGYGRPPDLTAARAHWRAKKRSQPAEREAIGPGEESVWDYPRPPRLEPAHRPVRALLAGRVVAASTRALRVVETGSPPVYYVPPGDVVPGLFVKSELESFCEWKGLARYFDLRVGDVRAENAAWSYPEPDEGFEPLRDFLAIYPGRALACYLGDERVRAQPGHFYGGWVSDGIKGPFKGEPGTEDW